MEIVLQQIAEFDYTEETDKDNEVRNLLQGCIDSIVDCLVSLSYTGSAIAFHHQNIKQLEFTTRALMQKYEVDLDKEIFGQKVVLLDTDVACMGRLLVYFGHALIQSTVLENENYDAESTNTFIRSLIKECYIIVTGVAQEYVWKRKQ